MGGSAVLGVMGLLVGIVMYGSMYVPVKKYKTYDGMLFQWYTSSGSVLIGVLVGILFDWGDDEGVTVPWEGILGGIVYAILSVAFPTVIKLTGLALGYVLWCGFSIVFGWAISRFGFFGLTSQAATYPVLDVIAIITCVVALVMMMFIRPDKVSVKAVKPTEKERKQSTQAMEYEKMLANAQNATNTLEENINDNNNDDNTNDNTNDNNNNNNNNNGNNTESSNYMWPTNSADRASSRHLARRRVSMEIVQSSSLIPTAYLFGTWLDFDQLAKDRYFEKKLKKKYNDDTIGIGFGYNSMSPSVSSVSEYGSTKETNTIDKHTASVNLKTIKNHNAGDVSDSEEANDILVEQYKEMRTDYQWLKPIIYGQCHCGPNARRVFGIFLGVLEGVIAAMSYVPYLYWKEQHATELEENELYILNYVFSYTIGIYLGSTFFFCIMGIYKKCYKLFWPKPVVRPAFSSGAMYALGYAGFLFATAYISYPICYIGVMVGSIVCSNLWSLVYFHEITNPRSIKLLSISCGLMTIAIIAEAIAG